MNVVVMERECKRKGRIREGRKGKTRVRKYESGGYGGRESRRMGRVKKGRGGG